MRHHIAAGLLILCATQLGCSTDSATSPSSKTAYTVFFGTAASGLDVSACINTVPAGLCSQIINVDSAGTFKEVWAPGTPTPNLLNVDGTLGSTSVTAVFKCVGTTASGSMNATLSGSQYSGTATLSGKTVNVRVVKGSSTTCS